MAGFPLHSPESRDINAFALREIVTKDGFAYAALPEHNHARPVGSANALTLLFRRLARSMRVN
jgi:hypothetical protein